jgi:hypothetical protein
MRRVSGIGIVGDGREQHAAQDHRLAADQLGQPAEEDQGGHCDQERDADDHAGGHHIDLGDLLQEVERPELPAVPDHALADQDDAGDHPDGSLSQADRRCQRRPGFVGLCPSSRRTRRTKRAQEPVL